MKLSDRPPWRQLSPHLWVRQDQPYRTNSGVWLSAGTACLVDPGLSPAAVADIARFVAERDARVRYVVLTHAHWDHLLGADAFPGAEIITHVAYEEVVAQHAADLQRQAADSGFSFPSVPSPTITFDDKLWLMVGDLRLHLHHAPGHAPDQCMLYEEESGVLWAADLLSDREIPLVMDVRAYQETLSMLAAWDIHVLVPGHGSPAESFGLIRGRVMDDWLYVHRLRTCVQRALDAGASLAETVAACADIRVTQPDDYPNARRWNVESAFGILSDRTLEDHCSLGWEAEWQI